MTKIIRSICLFRRSYHENDLATLTSLADELAAKGYVVQTKRLCVASFDPTVDDAFLLKQGVLLSHGKLSYEDYQTHQSCFLNSVNRNICFDLTSEEIADTHVEILTEIVRRKPAKTFEFTYGFNVPASSPFFPSAYYEQEGFSIGLQSTDLAEGCQSLGEWLKKTKDVWTELHGVLCERKEYLGIDSSVAPIFDGKGSLIYFMKHLKGSFDRSVLSHLYTEITNFIKTENPKPVGLCGLMFPCLEDFELALEYERGNFSVERNIFLSLHSGLGIDTYPIGIDEDKGRILDILRLIQALSNKYKKALSVRFVSDGRAKIGEVSDFQNPYLKDVLVRKL